MGIQAIMSLPRWRVCRGGSCTQQRAFLGAQRRAGWGQDLGGAPVDRELAGDSRAGLSCSLPSGAWSCGPKGKGETKEMKERGRGREREERRGEKDSQGEWGRRRQEKEGGRGVEGRWGRERERERGRKDRGRGLFCSA